MPPTTEPRRRQVLALRGALVACLSCGEGESAHLPPLPESQALTDTNPDPGIVEVHLVAVPSTVEYLPGTPTQVWAYRDGAIPGSVGTVPGPLLRAKLGDEVIVHFRNELSSTTTLHFHGPRVPQDADGSHVSDHGVSPGASSVQSFVVQDAGSFWYHPHRDAYDQIERGLHGPMILEGGVPLDVSADRYLVLDDVKVSEDGTLPAEISDLDLLFGRRGNVLLVNGKRAPLALSVGTGARERWRLVNTANGRYFNLHLPGLRFLVIASDGGLLPQPYETDTLLIAPGERYEVLVTFDGQPGTRKVLENVHYDRGDGSPDAGPQSLLQLTYGAPARASGPLPAARGELPGGWRAAEATIRKFTLGEEALPGGAMLFPINDQLWPDGPPVEVRYGAVELWEITNDTGADHPVHLHGMFFGVLQSSTDQKPISNGWKDTVNVPRRSTIRLAVRFDNPGVWMFQCHILEHADAGSMINVIVRP